MNRDVTSGVTFSAILEYFYIDLYGEMGAFKCFVSSSYTVHMKHALKSSIFTLHNCTKTIVLNRSQSELQGEEFRWFSY